MSKILFSGCSYIDGVGFAEEKQDPNLWVNLLHQENPWFRSLDLVNVGLRGRSNAGIFQDSIWHLTQDHFDFAVVSWTSMPRFEMELGLETYATRQVFVANGPTRTHNLNDIVYDQKYLAKIRDRLITLVHLHGEILNLVYYVNCLVKIAERQGTRIFFVNALCPWDKNYFVELKDFMPEEATEFTKKEIINLENRKDEEFFLLYKKIHTEYQQAGGIQEKHWLNLYNSLRQNKIDTNDDDLHPGIKSNKLYCKFLNQALQQMI